MSTLKIKSTQQPIKVGEHQGENMYVMKVEHYNTMSANEIIDFACETYGVPKGSLRAAWEAIGEVISRWALEGHIVEIPGLGNIRAEVRAKAQKDAQDVSGDDVVRRKLMLTPKKSLKDALNSATLDITCYDMNGEEVRHTVEKG